MDFIFGLIVGFVVAAVSGVIKAVRQRKPAGTLCIDASDPDGPYLFLELSEDISTVIENRQVLLSVDTRDYISQK